MGLGQSLGIESVFILSSEIHYDPGILSIWGSKEGRGKAWRMAVNSGDFFWKWHTSSLARCEHKGHLGSKGQVNVCLGAQEKKDLEKIWSYSVTPTWVGSWDMSWPKCWEFHAEAWHNRAWSSADTQKSRHLQWFSMCSVRSQCSVWLENRRECQELGVRSSRAFCAMQGIWILSCSKRERPLNDFSKGLSCLEWHLGKSFAMEARDESKNTS